MMAGQNSKGQAFAFPFHIVEYFTRSIYYFAFREKIPKREAICASGICPLQGQPGHPRLNLSGAAKPSLDPP